MAHGHHKLERGHGVTVADAWVVVVDVVAVVVVVV